MKVCHIWKQGAGTLFVYRESCTHAICIFRLKGLRTWESHTCMTSKQVKTSVDVVVHAVFEFHAYVYRDGDSEQIEKLERVLITVSNHESQG